MIKYIKDTLRPFKFKRGKNYPGDGTQRLRSIQIETLSSLTGNKKFISCFPELVACNESHLPVASHTDISKKIEAFFNHTNTWLNYHDQSKNLTQWTDADNSKYSWPKIHDTHRVIVDLCKDLDIKTVCDVGAGAGVVSKFIYKETEGRDLKITCLEGSDAHIAQMKENFNESKVIAPPVKVKAEIVKGIIQNAPFKDDTFDLVFTCTVIMHNSFIPAVLAIAEMTRISSRYVLYVEGYHVDGIPKLYNDTYDRLVVDYEKLHTLLGYKTIRKTFHKDPHSEDYEYIVYLAEKIK